MRLDLTPVQKIHFLMLQAAGVNTTGPLEYADATGAEIDSLISDARALGYYQELAEEVRESGTETGLPVEPVSYVEAKAVAAMLPDETWVGWTYYYGGGKHAYPEEIEWIETAHNVHCVPTVMTVNVFQRFTDADLAAALGEAVNAPPQGKPFMVTYDEATTLPPADVLAAVTGLHAATLLPAADQPKTIESRTVELLNMAPGDELTPADFKDANEYGRAIHQLARDPRRTWKVEHWRDAATAGNDYVFRVYCLPF